MVCGVSVKLPKHFRTRNELANLTSLKKSNEILLKYIYIETRKIFIGVEVEDGPLLSPINTEFTGFPQHEY